MQPIRLGHAFECYVCDLEAQVPVLVVEAESEQEVADLIAQDPFVVQGIFVLRSLKQWVLFLDARRKV